MPIPKSFAKININIELIEIQNLKISVPKLLIINGNKIIGDIINENLYIKCVKNE
tara:strand:- start:459 stop:623 length:165 start_codon:yes stop_codon:yes gene_type:complete